MIPEKRVTVVKMSELQAEWMYLWCRINEKDWNRESVQFRLTEATRTVPAEHALTLIVRWYAFTQFDTRVIYMVTAGQTLPMLYISIQYGMPVRALQAIIKLMIRGWWCQNEWEVWHLKWTQCICYLSEYSMFVFTLTQLLHAWGGMISTEISILNTYEILWTIIWPKWRMHEWWVQSWIYNVRRQHVLLDTYGRYQCIYSGWHIHCVRSGTFTYIHNYAVAQPRWQWTTNEFDGRYCYLSDEWWQFVNL